MPTSTSEARSTITRLLQAHNAGDAGAMDRLIDLVYAELCAVARRYVNQERPDHTLDSRALVHEAYARLLGGQDISWKNRKHFYVIFARAMRRILCDYARRHQAAKRGGGVPLVTLSMPSQVHPEDTQALEEHALMLLSLDQALDRLEAFDPDLAEVVHLRYYQGMTIEETADLLGRSTRSVKRDWQIARKVLYHFLGRDLFQN